MYTQKRESFSELRGTLLWWWVIFFLSVHKIIGQRENLRASAGICGIFLEVVIKRKSNSMEVRTFKSIA